jgi:5-methylcytosine-specific restriction endonuclease McrA
VGHSTQKESLNDDLARMELSFLSPKLRRKYLWAKSGGRCWYCGAQLYNPEEANTEIKKRLILTADHVHPRSRGGRGRANKVPACKFCNSHKSSRSVEEFREWLRARVFGSATETRARVGEHVTRRWKIDTDDVVFYFELARLSEDRLG